MYVQSCSLATSQRCSLATSQRCSLATSQRCSLATSQRCSLATSQRCSLATSQRCSHYGKAKVGRGMGTRLGAVSLVVMVTQHMPCRYPSTEHEQEGGSDWTKFKCYQNHARQLQCKPTTTHLAHSNLVHTQGPHSFPGSPPPPPRLLLHTVQT